MRNRANNCIPPETLNNVAALNYKYEFMSNHTNYKYKNLNTISKGLIIWMNLVLKPKNL